MTDKEKLKKALDALKSISAKVYAEFTVPVMETVEVKRWLTQDGKVFLLKSYADDHQSTLTFGQVVELTGTYSRPIEEKEGIANDPDISG